MSEAVDDGSLLTLQNPADVVGETVFDCRPSVLPVSIPLSGLSPGTVAEARESSSFQLSEETGKSIMDMDTNENTISRIVRFEWDEPGTDLEDEMPTPVLSPVCCTCDPSFRNCVGIAGLEQPPPLPVPTSAATPVVTSVATAPFIPTMPPTPDDRRNDSSTGSVRQTDRAKVFVVEATEGSTLSAMCQGAQDIGPDLTREGPFDACEAEPEPGQSPLVLNSMPGCQFRMTSYDDRDNRDDLDPAYGIHLHDPRMMEYMGAPESARLLGRSPEYWLEHMGRDRAVSAALGLHHDASLIMTNVQVMSQFVTSLNRTASEVMRTLYAREPFPTDAVHFVTPGRRVRRAAHYMAAMGLWRPTSAPVFPGPISVSSCNSCMACEDCFPDAPQ